MKADTAHAADTQTPAPGILDHWTARATALLVAVFGFVPIVNLLPGGRQASWYSVNMEEWISGTAIAAGVGVVLALVSRRLGVFWRDDNVLRHAPWIERHHYRLTMAICAAAFVTYALLAVHVLSARPLLIDEIVQLMQARTFLQGAASMPADANTEFFSMMHVIDGGGRVYGQFPAGGPAMLALGEWFGAPWLVGPVFGGISIFAFSVLVRRIEHRPTVALASVSLFALAPFTLFMSASHMNHVTALTWILLGAAALARVVSTANSAPISALCCGFCFGVAATIRPLDAFAFALPAGLWLLYRTAREPRSWMSLLAAGLGVALPMLVLMAVNQATTGAPLRFGYQVLWGSSHDLGFHSAPWGLEHTPKLGLELVSLYFLRLQTYLFETPIPSLLPAIVALALTRRLGALDRYLIVSGALLLGLYFAYWHDGFYLGPRFVYPLVPALALWSARMPALVRERFGAGSIPHRATVYAVLVSATIGLAVLVPARARNYAAGMLSMRWDADTAAASHGVRNALVLVRESWGSQLVSRLWALGVSRPDTELVYRNVDLCMLEEAVTRLEANGTAGEAALAELTPLLADSARTIGSVFSSDPTGRILPGTWYTARCLARAREEAKGFTVLPPILLAQGGGNIYARDLHERNSILLERYPDRPVYLLRPERDELGLAPRFYAVDRDSALAHWSREIPSDSGGWLTVTTPAEQPPLPVELDSPGPGSPRPQSGVHPAGR